MNDRDSDGNTTNEAVTFNEPAMREMLAYITVHGAIRHKHPGVKAKAIQELRDHQGGKLRVEEKEHTWLNVISQLQRQYDTITISDDECLMPNPKKQQGAYAMTTHAQPTLVPRDLHGGRPSGGKTEIIVKPKESPGGKRGEPKGRSNGGRPKPKSPSDKTQSDSDTGPVKTTPRVREPAKEASIPAVKLKSFLQNKSGQILMTSFSSDGENDSHECDPCVWKAVLPVTPNDKENSKYFVDSCANLNVRTSVIEGIAVRKLIHPFRINETGNHIVEYCQDILMDLEFDGNQFKFSTRIFICPSYIASVVSTHALSHCGICLVTGGDAFLYLTASGTSMQLCKDNGFPILVATAQGFDQFEHGVEGKLTVATAQGFDKFEQGVEGKLTNPENQPLALASITNLDPIRAQIDAAKRGHNETDTGDVTLEGGEVRDDHVTCEDNTPVDPRRKRMSLMQAHRMLGHCKDVKAIRAYCKEDGITITDQAWNQCISCDMNNIKNYQHTGTINRDPNAWSVDIKVAGAPKDLCKHNSAILFVNNHNHQMHTQVITSRAVENLKEVYEDFVQIYKPKHLHSDNAKEFIAMANEDVLKDVECTFTPGGYQPAANGIAEEAIGTVSRKTNIQLHAQHLNKRLWDDSWIHAVGVTTMLPRRELDYMNPDSQYPQDKRKAGIPQEYLLEFGCPVIVHVTKQVRDKTATSKGNIAIYIGGDKQGFHYISKDGAGVTRSLKVITTSWPELAMKQPDAFRDLEEFFDFHVGEDKEEHVDTDDGDKTHDAENHTDLLQNRRKISASEMDKYIMVTDVHAGEIPFGETVSWGKSQRLQDKHDSLSACVNELSGLHKAGVFLEVKTEDLYKVTRDYVTCRMKIKRKKTGKYKGRLCADGREHLLSDVLKEFDRYASTSGITELKVLLSIAAAFGMDLCSADCKQAYIRANMTKDTVVAVRLEKELPSKYYPQKGYTFVLKKALYGLPFSGNLWHKRLTEVLESLGFKAMKIHDSIFIVHGLDGVPTLIILAYVDDLIIAYKSIHACEQMLTNIGKHFPFTLQTEKVIKHLGATIHRNDDLSFYLEQSDLANEIVEYLGLTHSQVKAAPLPVSAGSVEREGERLDTELSRIYRSVIGRIGYLTHTRPDLVFTRHLLARFTQAPTREHLLLAVHAGKYIAATVQHGLSFTTQGALEIECFSDSDHATNKDDRFSVSGLALFIGGNYVYGESTKQDKPAHSSADAEIRACARASRVTVGYRNMFELMGLKMNTPSNMYVDNSAALSNFGHKNVRSALKHIAIDISMVRTYQDDGDLRFHKVDTLNNISDLMTKVLDARRIKDLCVNVVEAIPCM